MRSLKLTAVANEQAIADIEAGKKKIYILAYEVMSEYGMFEYFDPILARALRMEPRMLSVNQCIPKPLKEYNYSELDRMLLYLKLNLASTVRTYNRQQDRLEEPDRRFLRTFTFRDKAITDIIRKCVKRRSGLHFFVDTLYSEDEVDYRRPLQYDHYRRKEVEELDGYIIKDRENYNVISALMDFLREDSTAIIAYPKTMHDEQPFQFYEVTDEDDVA